MTSASAVTPRIALISAVTAAMDPAVSAFEDAFESVDLWHILDSRLLDDARQSGGVTPSLQDRMRRLIQHAESEGADAVLLTCSLYGQVAAAYSSRISVMAPDQAAFDDLCSADFDNILIISSIPDALADTRERLSAALKDAGSSSAIDGLVVDGAFESAAAHDTATLSQQISHAVREYSQQQGFPGAVFLAQYSLAPATTALSTELAIPVISGPTSAARVLRQRLSP